MQKTSYTVPCPTWFRDAVSALAEHREMNAGDLARSVMLLVPEVIVDGYPDPGEPAPDDRETVTLKSGPAAGKLWQRKPRLQVRLPRGFDTVSIRKALALALALNEGALSIEVAAPGATDSRTAENARLRDAVAALSSVVLPDGVRTEAEALYVLGFPPGARPARESLRQRFRELAAVHHPDSGVGGHRLMAQLNAAMDILRSVAA